MSPPNHEELRKRMDSLSERVNKNEQDYGEALRQVSTGQGEIQQVRQLVDQLALRVGDPPEGNNPGTGMARDLAELKATVGSAPNTATGVDGTGIAGTLAEVKAFVQNAQTLAESQAAKPTDLLRKVQMVSGIIGTLVLVGSVFSGCGAVLVWLFKRLPLILAP